MNPAPSDPTSSADLSGGRPNLDAIDPLELVARIGHEVRGPLTSILGFAELLHDEDEDPRRRFENVRAIQRNGKHLLGLVNDLLDLSQLQSGKFRIQREPSRVFELIQEAVTLMRFRAERRGLQLHCHVEWPFPEAVETDGRRLRQVLWNLLGNAVSYTERGEVALRCRFEDLQGEGWIHLTIEDSGPGIAPHDQERVFRPFERGASAGEVAGSGLGLAISRELVAALGGRLTLKSQAGVGSIFEVALPVGAADSLHLVPREPVLVSAATPTPLGSGIRLAGHVLYVEDDRDIRRVVTQVLERSGLTVTCARNGIEALEKLFPRRGRRRGEHSSDESNRAPDILLLDVEMPHMDGAKTLEQVRSRGWDSPVVFVTGHTRPSLHSELLEAGADAVLPKPIDFDGLLRTIEGFLPSPGTEAAA